MDKRAELIEAVARELHRADRPHDPEFEALTEQTRVAYRILARTALDIALKAAAEIADKWPKPSRTVAPGIRDAILALTSEGKSDD